jgi:general secretion pathway protein D
MQAQAAAGQAGGPGSFAGKLKGPVSFVVDESTNTILVKCVGSDYRVIKGVIDKLAIFPRQVLIRCSSRNQPGRVEQDRG